ncbi:hypothetical protein GOODEAATRI_015493 [Goodea atripinnis]|uniref:Uncharacterized protein n=1 Tax=Goodea atripinnis TaxID=208336 RepID=A0ABV0NN00_9TELE
MSSRLHFGVLWLTNPDRMFPANLDPVDARQDAAMDRWVQHQIEEAKRLLPEDLEVLPSPLLLEEMEHEVAQRRDGQEDAPLLLPLPQFSLSDPASPCCHRAPELKPASPWSGHGTVNLFNYLSREAEKTPCRGVGLSVPQPDYDGSRLAIPCLGTGPLSCLSSSPFFHPAAKPLSSSHRKKSRRGAIPILSASEDEVPMSTAETVAAMFPKPSSASAPSPRPAATLPLP